MGDLKRETAEVLAAARAVLGELVEEGVDRIPATAEAAKPAVESPTLEAVRAELGECTRCGLSEGRTQIVFGDGNPHANLLFIGEGPGEQEDLRGVPLVGRAGELLTRMIEKGLGMIVTGFVPSPLGHVTSYIPTAPELGISLGIFGIGALMVTMLYKVALSVRGEVG